MAEREFPSAKYWVYFFNLFFAVIGLGIMIFGGITQYAYSHYANLFGDSWLSAPLLMTKIFNKRPTFNMKEVSEFQYFTLFRFPLLTLTWDNYRISDYATTDESYYQTRKLHYVIWNVLTGLPKMFKAAPVWGKEDRKYLKQVKFRCYMYKYGIKAGGNCSADQMGDRTYFSCICQCHPSRNMQFCMSYSSGQAAIKTTNKTSHLIKEDFTFTSSDLQENPNSLKEIFRGRKNERFAFMIHGWVTSHLRHDIHLKPFMDVVATDLRSKMRMNVIVVDWYDLAVWDYFVTSTGNTLYMAHAIHAAICELANIMEMTEEEKTNYLIRMVLMGHSLGSHVAGLVGELLKVPDANDAGRQVKRLGTIVGVDPAGPWFPPYGTKRHCVTLHDARRVLILHTGAILLGNPYRLGHEDYFARGGAQVVPLSPALSHMRGGNLIREIIWTQAIGYICMRPKHVYRDGDLSNESLIRRIQFDLTIIPEKESEIISHPIYLPVNLRYPYFDDKIPKKIPAYSRHTNKGWEKINFKYFNRFV